MRFRYRLAGYYFLQRLQNTQLHFSGRFARERYCQNLLGILYSCQEFQIPLNQQLGLARSGGCLDDKRTCDVERRNSSGIVVEK